MAALDAHTEEEELELDKIADEAMTCALEVGDRVLHDLGERGFKAGRLVRRNDEGLFCVKLDGVKDEKVRHGDVSAGWVRG